MNQVKKSASIKLGETNFECPVIEGTEGEIALDIAKLRGATGAVCLDHAFMNTASCDSKITFLDGEKGILHYRGYPIEQLAENSNFLEVSHLLIHGELPQKNTLDNFETKINSFNQTPEFIKNIIKAHPKEAHPMGILSSCVTALGTAMPQFNKQEYTQEEYQDIIAHLMGQMKNIAAYCYRHTNNLKFVHSSHKDYCQDFLHMMFEGADLPIDQEIIETLHALFILHADHEQNCSTSAVRLVGSSLANPYAAIASGINALWGPLHGGANQAVIEMLTDINNAGGDYRKFLARAKDKNDSFRLMGFGHRVYKNFDPRSKIIKKYCDIVLEKMGVQDPLLEIAKGLEEEALKDSYFVERKLYPNVDFYSGIIYKALRIPTNMFTVMFALGRLPGWLAQWKEMMESPATKIGRPRQIYMGYTKRDYPKK